MSVLSIDPGAKGYMCLLSPNLIDFISLSEPPLKIYDWLKIHILTKQPKVIMIEDVHSLYGMSAKSNFNFGYNLGGITWLCEIFPMTPLSKVQPKVWQKYIGITSKGKAIKEEVASKCKEIYPDVDIYGKRGGLLDGKSDSLMIAHYAANIYKEQ